MAFNLADYEKMDTVKSQYVKFEKTGDTKFFRFMYKSGGNEMGKDIPIRRKQWDEESRKFIYDGPTGQSVCALQCIEYDEGGGNPRKVIWERSAYFCKNVLLPMWRNYPRICDGVWKVTATTPKTIEASYSLFPVLDADTISYPIIEDEDVENNAGSNDAKTPKKVAKEVSKPAATAPKKKYWEV